MAEMIGDVELPATESYRVVNVGATYYEPVVTIGPDGKPTVVLAYRVAGHGARVELVADQAHRLVALGAVRAWDEPKDYAEMDDAELRAVAASRGVPVASSSADPEQPLRTDYLNALATYDLGQDAAVVGAASVPGGVQTVGAQVPVVFDGRDARGVPSAALADWIKATAPTPAATVATANGDAVAASALLEAESAATGGDSRPAVVKGLQKIIGGGSA